MAGARLLRLTLVCQAATEATRRAAFPDDEPIEAGGLRRAAAVAAELPRHPRVWVSPARAAGETMAALQLQGVVVAALGDCDYGAWRGIGLEAVPPDGLAAWLSDPDAAPHGGESLTALFARVAEWLETDLGDGPVVAVTHAAVVRAAILHVLEARASAFWRIDVAPLSLVRLQRSGGRWTLRV